MIGSALYFGTYETVKPLLQSSTGPENGSSTSILFAGAMCGLASWALVCP